MQIAPNADTDHRAVRKIQRAMERSRQATNPENYETVDVVRHGKKRKSLKVKSGRLQWRFSKHYEKLSLIHIYIGMLKPSRRAAGKGRNVHTGEIIVIPAKRTVTFKPFKKLKETLNRE